MWPAAGDLLIMPELTTIQELNARDFGVATFNALCCRDGLRHVRRAGFPASGLTVAKLSAFGTVQLAEETNDEVGVVLRAEPEMLIYLYATRGRSGIAVAGSDRDAVNRVTEDVVASLRDPEPTDDQVPVDFWAYATGHLTTSRRRITAPAWDEIAGNYGAGTRAALAGLMAARGGGPGRLLLWHGAPGTGKSYALRALAREWRGWCDTHMITDADAFLGASSSYLIDTLLRGRDDRWRLIVLEDAGELLAADARATAGQALSRLLNLTDGLLGEGLRATVLVTTNEPLGRLHPAVARPGRAWAEVEFGALPAGDANEWLSRHAGDLRVDRPATLAELFALAAGRAPAARGVGLGFAAVC